MKPADVLKAKMGLVKAVYQLLADNPGLFMTAGNIEALKPVIAEMRTIATKEAANLTLADIKTLEDFPRIVTGIPSYELSTGITGDLQRGFKNYLEQPLKAVAQAMLPELIAERVNTFFSTHYPSVVHAYGVMSSVNIHDVSALSAKIRHFRFAIDHCRNVGSIAKLHEDQDLMHVLQSADAVLKEAASFMQAMANVQWSAGSKTINFAQHGFTTALAERTARASAAFDQDIRPLLEMFFQQQQSVGVRKP